ncbi:MAG: tetratricopeptide repeat protein [Candidatus Eisenbacteria bacterium]|nr:tetratricopeptide repeat protein [Candidatus Eisenbacteria bacterium]
MALAFQAGQTLDNRYRLGQRLREDSFGVTFRAYDERVRAHVALRVLGRTPELEEQLEEFGHRVARSQDCAYPSVSRAYGVVPIVHRGEKYILLPGDLPRGKPLAAGASSSRRMRETAILPFVREFVLGLDLAHTQGLCHLAISDTTLCVVKAADSHKTQLVLTDFVLGGIPVRGRTSSLRGWLAPEQLREDPAGPSADIYAVGVLLFRLLTGEMPMSPEQAEEWAVLPPRDPVPVSVRRRLEKLPKRWAARLERCLAWDPAERFYRVGEVLGDVSSQPRLSLNLPAEASAFVGRTHVLRLLTEKLSRDSHVVTISGESGVGKTRLATRFAWEHMEMFPGGVALCDLSSVRDDVDEVLHALRTGIRHSILEELTGERKAHGHDATTAICSALAAAGSCLLILDGADEGDEALKALMPLLISAAPAARFLVTRREAPGVSDDESVTLQAMDAPHATKLARALKSRTRPAVAIALATAPKSPREALSGSSTPLQLEIRHAWTTLEACRPPSRARVIREPESAYVALAGGKTSNPSPESLWGRARHLLAPWELEAWKQCTVFDGGWTVLAARGVLDLGRWPEVPSMGEVMKRLAEARVIVTASVQTAQSLELEGPRYAMHDYLRSMAKALFHGTAEEEAAHRRHGEFFAETLGSEHSIRRFHAVGDVKLRRRLEYDLSNLIVASKRAIARRDHVTALSSFEAAHCVLVDGGSPGYAATLGRRVHMVQRDSNGKGRALRLVAIAQDRNGETTAAAELLGQALREFEAAQNVAMQETTLAELAKSYLERDSLSDARSCILRIDQLRATYGREIGAVSQDVEALFLLKDGRPGEAVQLLEKALERHRSAGLVRYQATASLHLANAHAQDGRWKKAKEMFLAHIPLVREMGDKRAETAGETNLSVACQNDGDPEGQLIHAETALRLSRQVGDKRLKGIVLNNCGNAYFGLGRVAEASELYERALPIHEAVQSHAALLDTKWNLGEVALRLGQLDVAEVRLQEVLSLYERLDRYNQRVGVAEYRLADIARRRGRIEEAEERCLRSEQILRAREDEEHLPQLLCVQGHLALAHGRVADAQALLAEAVSRAHIYAEDPRFEVSRSVQELRETIGRDISVAFVEDVFEPENLLDRNRLTYRGLGHSLAALALPLVSIPSDMFSPSAFGRILANPNLEPARVLEAYALHLRVQFMVLSGLWPGSPEEQERLDRYIGGFSAESMDSGPSSHNLQQYLAGLEGRDLGTYAAKSRFSKALKDILLMSECRLACGATDCGEPSMLRAYVTRTHSGGLGFVHRVSGEARTGVVAGSGAYRTTIHGGGGHIPSLVVIGLFPVQDSSSPLRQPQREES